MNIYGLVRQDFVHDIECVGNMVKGIQHQEWGCNFHGYTPKDLPSGKYDFSVSWGIRNGSALNRYTDNNLIIENAYFNNVQIGRRDWVSCGWNGLNGRANFCNKNSPDDRWKKYFDDGRLKEWSDGDYILLPLQIKSDMNMVKLVENGFSYINVIREIRKFTDLPIKIKHHPTRHDGWNEFARRASQGGKNISEIDKNMPINDAIKNAKVVVIANSNCGVDAILAGKPVIALDEGSMVYDLAEHDFSKINNPPFPDRTQWCNDVAYAQWDQDEIKSGKAWRHLKNYLCTK